MIQQLIALVIIAALLGRLFWQKKRSQVSGSEFMFWLVFWVSSGLAILFIRRIDLLVANLGFSGTGIQILFYLSIVFLFYLVFRLRLRVEKSDRELTRIVKALAIRDQEGKL